MMKVALQTAPDATAMQLRTPIKVCMHVLGTARNDVRVMREAVTLVRSGYAVSIVDVEGTAHIPVEEEIQGVRLKHIFVSNDFLSTRFARWTLVRAVFILLQGILHLMSMPTDIYHAHDVSGLLPCFIAAQLRRKPLIFDAHELPLTNTDIRSRWLLRVLSFLLKWIIPTCAGVITVSPPIQQEIQQRYRAHRISLIRNVPAYRALAKGHHFHHDLGLPPQTRIVLFQGYLLNSRGLDVLIPAAKFLDPDIVIVIMGKDIEGCISRLTSLAEHEDVADRVKIIPPVAYADLFDWTASADIGVILYQPDYSLNIKMCLPNKFFEYLMAGLPVLASQLDAIADIIQTYHVGKIVSSLAPEEIGKAINSMLADQASYECMRQHALEAAQKDLCWEQEEQQLIQLYHTILKFPGNAHSKVDPGEGKERMRKEVETR